MQIEHFAVNVEEPMAMSKWYVDHLGMKLALQETEAPFKTFLADDSGQVMIEMYRNTEADIPDYQNMHPLVVHLAFVSEHPENDKKRLLDAGATLVSEDHLDDGSHLVMLRDPWGLAIQLCKRVTPM